jgi:hypothetical protein
MGSQGSKGSVKWDLVGEVAAHRGGVHRVPPLSSITRPRFSSGDLPIPLLTPHDKVVGSTPHLLLTSY